MIDRYTRPEMRVLWSDLARYKLWLEIELAVCHAMEAEGSVPHGTADVIKSKVVIDPVRIEQIEQRTRHDVIAFLTHVEEQAGPPARWLHLGLTSSDVLDTAFAMQLVKAGHILMEDLKVLMTALENKAKELKNQPIIGRTHGIHAEPTSMGLIFTSFYAEMNRNKERLARANTRISFGKIAGAVGNYGSTSPDIEDWALTLLNLRPEPCATQVVPRDRHAEFFSTLAIIASSVERIALQVRHWQRTEVGEASEPFYKGQKGSSAMPHKRNPILSENLCGLARLVRSNAMAALENVALWHERDISHSSVERVIGPDSTGLLDFMLNRLSRMITGLVIYPERIEENLNSTKGLVFSEVVMLALIKSGMDRQEAYELVQLHASANMEKNETSLLLSLMEDPEIGERISLDTLISCFDVKHHLRHVNSIYDRVFMA